MRRGHDKEVVTKVRWVTSVPATAKRRWRTNQKRYYRTCISGCYYQLC